MCELSEAIVVFWQAGGKLDGLRSGRKLFGVVGWRNMKRIGAFTHSAVICKPTSLADSYGLAVEGLNDAWARRCLVSKTLGKSVASTGTEPMAHSATDVWNQGSC